MALKRPPKLTEIVTAGSGELKQIQLKFKGGIESPVIDANPSDTAQTESYRVRDFPIRSITCREYDCKYLHQIKITYDDNGKEEVTRLYDRDGVEAEKLLPAKHVIVGFYGTYITNNWISSLGFILMDVSTFDN